MKSFNDENYNSALYQGKEILMRTEAFRKPNKARVPMFDSSIRTLDHRKASVGRQRGMQFEKNQFLRS